MVTGFGVGGGRGAREGGNQEAEDAKQREEEEEEEEETSAKKAKGVKRGGHRLPLSFVLAFVRRHLGKNKRHSNLWG